MKGEVGILNVGAGDTKLTFDPSKPKEAERAARVVTDMLKRGYSIMVQAGTDSDGEPLFKRARAFDPKTHEYIIADFDAEAAALNGDPDEEDAAGAPASSRGTAEGKPRRGRPSKVKRIKASGTRAVAVARSAGG